MKNRNILWQKTVKEEVPHEYLDFYDINAHVPAKVVYSNATENYVLECSYSYSAHTDRQKERRVSSFVLSIPDYKTIDPVIEKQLQALGVQFYTTEAVYDNTNSYKKLQISYSENVSHENGKFRFVLFLTLLDKIVNLDVCCDASNCIINILSELHNTYLNINMGGVKSQKQVMAEASRLFEQKDFGSASRLVRRFVYEYSYFEPIWELACKFKEKGCTEFAVPLFEKMTESYRVKPYSSAEEGDYYPSATFAGRWVSMAYLALAEYKQGNEKNECLEKALKHAHASKDPDVIKQATDALAELKKDSSAARKLGQDIWQNSKMVPETSVEQKPIPVRRHFGQW